MAFRMIDRQWHREFEKTTTLARQQALIITPFLQRSTLENLLGNKPKEVKVITRFNLDDFQRGVSDINALEYLLHIGAQVKGIRNLHSKVYIFGSAKAIVTSANLTHAALFRNSEFGIESDDVEFLQATESYFKRLWNKAGTVLNKTSLLKWTHELAENKDESVSSKGGHKLGDYGADLKFEEGSDIYSAKSPTLSGIDFNSFITFCKGKQNRMLTTIGGRRSFTVEVQNETLRYTPESTKKPRTFLRRKDLGPVLKKYNESKSLRPRDYTEMTVNASYTLALIKLYVVEQPKS